MVTIRDVHLASHKCGQPAFELFALFVGHPRRCGSNTALSISQARAPCGSSTLICGNPQVLGRNAEGCGSGNRLALQRTAWLSHPRSQRTSEGCRLSTSGRCMEPQFFPSTSEAPRSPRWGFFFSGGAIGHDRAPVQETRDEVCGADHQRGTSTPSLTGAPEANSARSRSRRRRSTSRRSSRRSGCTADR